MIEIGTYFKGVCCIVAPTQSFKTTIASLFFDYNNGREADINFEATTAAIVRTIGNTRDTTVILDDYKPGATKAEQNDMMLKLEIPIKAIQLLKTPYQKGHPVAVKFYNQMMSQYESPDFVNIRTDETKINSNVLCDF